MASTRDRLLAPFVVAVLLSALLPLSVAQDPTAAISPAYVVAGNGSVTCEYTYPAGIPTRYFFIGFYRMGAPANFWLNFEMQAQGSTAGSATWITPDNVYPDQYFCALVQRVYPYRSVFEFVAQSDPATNIAAPATATVSTADGVVAVTAGDSINCTWTATPGAPGWSFIGLYKTGSAEGAFVKFQWLPVGAMMGLWSVATPANAAIGSFWECRIGLTTIRKVVYRLAVGNTFAIK